MFVNADGGLTTAGYVLFIVLAVIALLAASVIAGKASKKGKMSAKQIAFCSMAIALAYVTSYIKLFSLPFSGSVTLCSMLFIVLVGYWSGPATGILVGFVYGILQFIQKPYYLTLFQVCADYLLAFSALGLSGFFSGKKNGLTIGYLVGVFGRGVFNALAGYMYWMEYMPETFPKSLAALYPIVYNFGFLLAEAVITLIIINFPAVSRGLERIRNMALE